MARAGYGCRKPPAGMEYTGCPCLQKHEFQGENDPFPVHGQPGTGLQLISICETPRFSSGRVSLPSHPPPRSLQRPAELAGKADRVGGGGRGGSQSEGGSRDCQGRSILTVARASPAGAGAAPRLQVTAGNRGAARGGAAAAGSLRGTGSTGPGESRATAAGEPPCALQSLVCPQRLSLEHPISCEHPISL